MQEKFEDGFVLTSGKFIDETEALLENICRNKLQICTISSL